jgi:hypothetical protein
MIDRIIVSWSTWRTGGTTSIVLWTKSVAIWAACKATSITALVIIRTAAATVAGSHFIFRTKIFS